MVMVVMSSVGANGSVAVMELDRWRSSCNVYNRTFQGGQ